MVIAEVAVRKPRSLSNSAKQFGHDLEDQKNNIQLHAFCNNRIASLLVIYTITMDFIPAPDFASFRTNKFHRQIHFKLAKKKASRARTIDVLQLQRILKRPAAPRSMSNNSIAQLSHLKPSPTNSQKQDKMSPEHGAPARPISPPFPPTTSMRKESAALATTAPSNYMPAALATPPDSSIFSRKRRASESDSEELEADGEHQVKRVLTDIQFREEHPSAAPHTATAPERVLTYGKLNIDTDAEHSSKRVKTGDHSQSSEDHQSTAPTTPTSYKGSSPFAGDAFSATSGETSITSTEDVKATKPTSAEDVVKSADTTVRKSESVETGEKSTTTVQKNESFETSELDEEAGEEPEEPLPLPEAFGGIPYSPEDTGKDEADAEGEEVSGDMTVQKASSKYKVSGDPSPCKDVVAKGLTNEGVHCYRLVALQGILHSIKYVNWFLDYHPKEACVSDKGLCLTCILRDITVRYHSKARHVDDEMLDLHAYCEKKNYQCGGMNGQGDPDDFLRWMMNRMEDELPKELYLLFRSIGDIILETTMKCELCGYVSSQQNVHEGLISLNLTCRPYVDQWGFVNMYQLLELNKDECITGHKCDRCSRVSTKKKVKAVSHTPDVLTIAFNRYDDYGDKINTKIDFPAQLDLNDIGGYLTSNPTTPSARYALNSVITHAGDGLNWGHYRILAKHPWDGEFRMYDDDFCQMSSIECVTNIHNYYRRQSPYILSYSKIDEGAEHVPEIEAQEQADIEPEQEDAGDDQPNLLEDLEFEIESEEEVDAEESEPDWA